MDTITFPNGPISMAGNLYLPADFDPQGGYAAIVTVHPGGGVKEQTAGLYASKMAERGFVALAYDASHQGDSGGEPHYLEDPAARVEDIRAAVDHLQTLDFIDAERIGVLGICAGGGYAVNATMTDHRIKAVATVSGLNIGTSYREGWFGADPDSAAVPTLQAAARQRTAEAKGAAVAMIPYVPVETDENTPHDLVEAHDYYLTRVPSTPTRRTRSSSPRASPRSSPSTPSTWSRTCSPSRSSWWPAARRARSGTPPGCTPARAGRRSS
ncbi:MAG: alpha/beta hydrolase [Actinomadura sp.]